MSSKTKITKPESDPEEIEKAALEMAEFLYYLYEKSKINNTKDNKST